MKFYIGTVRTPGRAARTGRQLAQHGAVDVLDNCRLRAHQPQVGVCGRRPVPVAVPTRHLGAGRLVRATGAHRLLRHTGDTTRRAAVRRPADPQHRAPGLARRRPDGLPVLPVCRQSHLRGACRRRLPSRRRTAHWFVLGTHQGPPQTSPHLSTTSGHRAYSYDLL